MSDARNLEGTGALLLEGGAFRALESYVAVGGGPAVVGAFTYANGGGVSSCAVDKPACSVGDVLVWFMGNTANQPVASYQTPDASAGTWALQGQGTTDGGGGYSANVSVYTRVVTGTEGATFQANSPAGNQEHSVAMVAVANAALTLPALSFAGAAHSTGPLNLPGVAVPDGGVGLVFALSYNGFGDAVAPASGPWLTLADWSPSVLLQFTGTGTSPTAVIPFGGGDTQGVQIAVATYGLLRG